MGAPEGDRFFVGIVALDRRKSAPVFSHRSARSFFFRLIHPSPSSFPPRPHHTRRLSRGCQWVELANMEIATKDLARASFCLEEAILVAPNRPDLHTLLAQVRARDPSLPF